jgi:hypothetical protein
MKHLLEANKWNDARAFAYPRWVPRFLHDLEMDVYLNSPLSKDFENGSIKLIPIIFSHGL